MSKVNNVRRFLQFTSDILAFEVNGIRHRIAAVLRYAGSYAEKWGEIIRSNLGEIGEKETAWQIGIIRTQKTA